MILTYGIVYMNYMPVGVTVNAAYLIDILGSFLKAMRVKRPHLIASNDWVLHWDNAPVHTARLATEFIAKKGIKMVPHAPYLPDLAPADFWLFPKIKANLALDGLIIENSVHNSWERLAYTIPTEEFRATWDKWLERHEKCIRIGGEYVEK